MPRTPDEYQTRYSCVDSCVYVPIIGSFNEWKFITFENSLTRKYAFDDIHKIIPYGILSHK